MMSLALHIVLIGFAMMFSELFREKGRSTSSNDIFPTAMGMILGGGLAGAYPTIVYALRYIKPSPAGVFRAALGINAIYTGIVFSIAITWTMISLMNDDKTIHVELATTFTYFSANLICVVPLLLDRRKLNWAT
jgi:hypothetical protein